jgi:hypothetical protein
MNVPYFKMERCMNEQAINQQLRLRQAFKRKFVGVGEHTCEEKVATLTPENNDEDDKRIITRYTRASQKVNLSELLDGEDRVRCCRRTNNEEDDDGTNADVPEGD